MRTIQSDLEIQVKITKMKALTKKRLYWCTKITLKPIKYKARFIVSTIDKEYNAQFAISRDGWQTQCFPTLHTSQAKLFSLKNPHFDCLRNPSGLKIIFPPHILL